MTAGLQVINDSGIYQIDELYRNYYFVEKYSFTTAGTHTFSTSAGRVAPILVFYSTWAATVDSGGHTNNTGGILLYGSSVSGTTWSYTVNGIGDCYIFDLPVNPASTGTGLQVFDGSNNCVFDSTNTPMIIRENRHWGGPCQMRYYYPVQTLSTAPDSYSYSVVEDTQFGSFAAYAKPSAQKWGWLANSVGASTVYFENTHAAGGPPNGDGNIHKFMTAMWASGDNFKVAAREWTYTGAYWNGNVDWNSQVRFVDLTNVTSSGGGAPAVTTTQSPGSQSNNGAASSYSFSPETVTVSGGAASAYSWSIINNTGGTWAIANGTTSTATASVSGITAGATASATLRSSTTVNGLVYQNDSALSFTNTSSGGGTVTVSSLSPGNASNSAAATGFSFGVESVSVSGGTSVSYNWSVSGGNGTWTIDSGQSTASAVARVAGVPTGATATGTLTCVVNVDGTNYPQSCSLSFQNTSSAGGVTFSPVPGTYNDGLDTWSVTASQSVTWSWTKTGSTARNTTTPVTSGTPATSFSTVQTDSSIGNSTVCTISLTASGAGSGSWTITVTSPGNGGGGTGGCVTADTFLPEIGQAGNVKVGDQLVIANPLTFVERKGIVSRADLKLAECVRIRTISGIELDCSTTAPIAIEDGSLVLAPDLLGKKVVVCDNGEYRYEIVENVTDIGEQPIMHITCEDDLFLAGKTPGRYILHHNVKA